MSADQADATEPPTAALQPSAAEVETVAQPEAANAGLPAAEAADTPSSTDTSAAQELATGQPSVGANDLMGPFAPPTTVPSVALSLQTPSAAIAPLASPARRRPKPPAKGILKPPPPPAKPTLGNRLRDMVAGSVSAVGAAKSLFDADEAGPSTRAASASAGAPAQPVNAAVGTFNAVSSRIGFGISRLVANATAGQQQAPAAPPKTREAEQPLATPVSEQSRQKQPLKRATFVLPSLSITYPISSQGEPWSVKVTEDRKRIESTHRTLLSTASGPGYWTATRLVELYVRACHGREEKPRLGILRALEIMPNPPRPRIIHLILGDPTAKNPSAPFVLDAPLKRHAAEALADVLSTEWALSDLRLEGGVIETDDGLKPILHALLISGTLPSLSLAGNKKIKASGWRLLAVFLKRARSLRYIDLSDTNWDRKGIEYLVQSLNCTHVQPPPSRAESPTPDTRHAKPLPPLGTEGTDEKDASRESSPESAPYGSFVPPAPLLRGVDDKTTPAAVQTLRLDGCGLKTTTLEPLAHGVRSSDVKNISLRRNRIGPLGAVSLAVMIRDYPDNALSMSSLSPALAAGSPSAQPSTTYAAYVPRARRAPPQDDDSSLPPIPLVVSGSNGVTSRVVPDGYQHPPAPAHSLGMPPGGYSAMQEGGASFAVSGIGADGRLSSTEPGAASLALQRSVRALDGVERIGRLLTLDLKGNEIGKGVGYIAQVLKRNRTLKVLNLSDNKIDSAGLAVLAEALKYNSALETLDLSSNPCCGPGMDGIAALRTSFTVNTTLKRLFLSDTNMTNEAAIALAEFIPENRSLLHLDLTSNPIDKAGVLAVSVGLKNNHVIRCLDVSITPNDPELAEVSQTILQSCIRNTETAAAALDGKPTKRAGQDAIWAPIKKSALVRHVKEADAYRAQMEREAMASSVQGLAREYVYRLKPARVPLITDEVTRDLEKWYTAARSSGARDGMWEPGQLPKDDYAPLLERARALRERVVEMIQIAGEGDDLVRLLSLNDALGSAIDRSAGFTPPPRLLLPSQIVVPPQPLAPRPEVDRSLRTRRHLRVASVEITSPNFSIGDSDAESDAEELDSSTLHGRLRSPRPLMGLLAGVELLPTSTIERGDGAAASPEPKLSAERALQDKADDVIAAELAEAIGMTSPTGRASRAWVEEEGEMFRKGTRLGVAEDEEEREVSGEELKQELAETEVPRDEPRLVADEAKEPAEASDATDAADEE